MTQQPYHKYVFDTENRKFVGRFEEMYANEEREGFDSWFQEELRHPTKQGSWELLKNYRFSSILDIGCGKGAFTNQLATIADSVMGVDISQTAIAKAEQRYPGIRFSTATAEEALSAPQRWDAIVMLEVLSYLQNWEEVLQKAAAKANYVYITLYLPPDPIGFVKSFEELREVFNTLFSLEKEVLKNNETIYLLG